MYKEDCPNCIGDGYFDTHCSYCDDGGEKPTSSKARWEVGTKGGPGKSHFEICVIRESSEHGKQSYGWFDDDKLLISHNGGPCRWPLTNKVWDKMILLAEEVAAELNQEESNL